MTDLKPNIEDRVSRAEWSIELHERELKELRDQADDLHNCITSIQTSLNQIKYAVIGAVVFAAASQMGIVEAIKVAM